MKKLTNEVASEVRSWLDTVEVKEFVAATKDASASDTGTFQVVITTENVDRYQEVIKLDGWELANYLANPVVLWGHDHSIPPIGICTSLDVVDGKMVASGQFAPSAFAQEIRALYDLGMERATSVGFIEKEREGNLITQAELIEFSFVSVPANPYALALAMEKDISINELVTKGFMDIKETEPVTDIKDISETPKEEAAVEPADEGQEVVLDEKTYSAKAVDPIIATMKSVIIALEALSKEEPEREEEAPADVETEAERQFRIFNANRKTVQELASLVTDVLATARKDAEAHRSGN